MIHERVKHARLYHGWSQTKLAEMVNVSQPAISQIEKTGQIADETLAAIANVTGYAPWWFEQGPLPDLPLGSLRFRRLAGSPLRDDERVRAHIRQALELLDRFAQAVDLPPVRVQASPSGQELTDEEIEMKALEVREWLGVGPLDPIPSLIRAVERSGVVVLGSALEIEKHDAVSFWSPDSGRPVICFSRGFSGDRQRLSLAHEVGHLSLHQYRSLERTRAEREAFRFAGALLIPATAAADEIETPVTLRSLAYVKAQWGISIAALIRRSLDLRIISDERRTSLEKQLSARGWRKAEPVLVSAERPMLMTKLIEAAVGKATPQRLHSVLGLPLLASKDLGS